MEQRDSLLKLKKENIHITIWDKKINKCIGMCLIIVVKCDITIQDK